MGDATTACVQNLIDIKNKIYSQIQTIVKPHVDIFLSLIIIFKN